MPPGYRRRRSGYLVIIRHIAPVVTKKKHPCSRAIHNTNYSPCRGARVGNPPLSAGRLRFSLTFRPRRPAVFAASPGAEHWSATDGRHGATRGGHVASRCLTWQHGLAARADPCRCPIAAPHRPHRYRRSHTRRLATRCCLFDRFEEAGLI